jgi:hypothetical protein
MRQDTHLASTTAANCSPASASFWLGAAGASATGSAAAGADIGSCGYTETGYANAMQYRSRFGTCSATCERLEADQRVTRLPKRPRY